MECDQKPQLALGNALLNALQSNNIQKAKKLLKENKGDFSVFQLDNPKFSSELLHECVKHNQVIFVKFIKYLITQKISLNTFNQQKETILTVALRNNYIVLSRILIKAGARVNPYAEDSKLEQFLLYILKHMECDFDYPANYFINISNAFSSKKQNNASSMEIKLNNGEEASFFTALKNNDVQTMKCLLQQGARLFPELKNYPIEEFLHEFIENTNESVLRNCGFSYLNFCLNFTGKNGFPLLYQCIMQGQLSVLKLLLQNQVNPNVAITVNDLETLREFKEDDCEFSFSIVHEKWKKVTPLHTAGFLMEDKMVQELLQFGAKITAAKTEDAKTEEDQFGPCAFAELNIEVSENMLMTLVNAGDFPCIHDDDNYLNDVVGRNHKHLLKLLLDEKVIQKIISTWPGHKEDILEHLRTDDTYLGPFLYSIKLRRISMIEDFLSAGQDPNEQEDKLLPLNLSVKLKEPDITRLLIQYKADINLKEKYAPLHCAAFFGDNKSLKLLCDNKANVDLLCDHGMSPVHYAALKNNIDALEILFEAGANMLLPGPNEWTIFDLAVLGGHWDLYQYLSKFGKPRLNLPINPDQLNKYNLKQQKFIISHFVTSKLENEMEEIVWHISPIPTLILKTVCGIDPKGIYEALMKANKGFYRIILQINRLLDFLLLYSSPNVRSNIMAHLAKENLDKEIKNPELLCSWGRMSATKLCDKNKVVKELYREFDPLFYYRTTRPFQWQATFANDLGLFSRNRELNRFVMDKLHCGYYTVQAIGAGGILPFMRTCKDAFNQFELGHKAIPYELKLLISNFLQPDIEYKAVQHQDKKEMVCLDQKITTRQIVLALKGQMDAIKTLPKPKPNIELHQSIIQNLIDLYKSHNGGNNYTNKELLERKTLTAALTKNIKVIVSDLKETKSSAMETKSDSSFEKTSGHEKIAAIEQSIINEVVRLFGQQKKKKEIDFDSLMSSEVVLRGLNKLIQLKSNKELLKIYYVEERTRFFNNLLNPPKTTWENNNSTSRVTKRTKGSSVISLY